MIDFKLYMLQMLAIYYTLIDKKLYLTKRLDWYDLMIEITVLHKVPPNYLALTEASCTLALNRFSSSVATGGRGFRLAVPTAESSRVFP